MAGPEVGVSTSGRIFRLSVKKALSLIEWIASTVNVESRNDSLRSIARLARQRAGRFRPSVTTVISRRAFGSLSLVALPIGLVGSTLLRRYAESCGAVAPARISLKRPTPVFPKAFEINTQGARPVK